MTKMAKKLYGAVLLLGLFVISQLNALAQLTGSTGSNAVLALDGNTQNAAATFYPYLIAFLALGISIGVLVWFLKRAGVRR